MTYSKRTDIPVGEGETAVELDNGALVAVSCVQTSTSGRVQYIATARAIAADGAASTDTNGQPITRTLNHSDANTSRTSAVSRDCLLAVLGETPETVQWGEQYLLDVSIRQAIELANITTGAIDAGAVL
jgi:hypothetical protein